VVQRGATISVSDESLHGEDNFLLGGGPLMCVVQKSKQIDDALKVYNSLSLHQNDSKGPDIARSALVHSGTL
jgi:hypothetical protein